MSEPQPPTPPPAPASPLGVDPVIDTPPEPTPPAPTPPSEPEGVLMSPEEVESLQAKARNFDTIAQDNAAMQLLTDHFREGSINNPAPNPPPPGDEPDLMAEIRGLKETLSQMTAAGQELQEQVGTLTIERFAQANPEFETHRHRVGEIMQTYQGMSIDRALTLAKAEAGLPSQPPTGEPPAAPAQPAVETNSAGSIPGAGNALGDAERRISSAKETPDFGEAVRAAVNAAKQHHGVN